MLCPTEETRRGVGKAMSSRARRTATMIAAAMTRVDVNLALMRACSSLASARAMWPTNSSIGEEKANTQMHSVESLFGSLPDESRYQIQKHRPCVSFTWRGEGLSSS